MASDKDQERSEEATPQRREDFRKRGQVAQTRELSSVLTLMGFAVLFMLLSKFYANQIQELYATVFANKILKLSQADQILDVARFVFKKGLLILAPALGLFLVISIISTLVQTGFLYTEDAISPNLNKLNPVEGFWRVFSIKSLVEGLKALAKLILIGFVVYFVIESNLHLFPKFLFLTTEQTVVAIQYLLFKVLVSITMVMLVITGFDYFYQRLNLENEMRMTKQEVKEETKSREGDPLIKSRIRKIQKDIATKRMMNDVPKADVIITNPTHIAIAIKYDSAKFPAPQILAKGADYVAEKIKNLAKEYNIPIIENKPLARTIFRTLEIGQLIPRELFAAVAEVLAYVYKLKRKLKK